MTPENPTPASSAAPTPASSAPAPAPSPAQPRTSKLSVITLILGLLWIPWPLAILCGHIARGRIRRSAGALKGKGIALLGLLLGYLGMFAAVASMIIGGLYLWRTTSAIRADIAAGKDPTETLMKQFGGPVAGFLLNNENLIPENIRAQLDTAMDESAEQRLQLAGHWMLEYAKTHNGRLPATFAEAAASAPASEGNAAITGNATVLAFFARGLAPVPGLNTSLPPDTVIAHAVKIFPDGTLPVCLLNGATARLQPSDPRLAKLKLNTP